MDTRPFTCSHLVARAACSLSPPGLFHSCLSRQFGLALFSGPLLLPTAVHGLVRRAFGVHARLLSVSDLASIYLLGIDSSFPRAGTLLCFTANLLLLRPVFCNPGRLVVGLGWWYASCRRCLHGARWAAGPRLKCPRTSTAPCATRPNSPSYQLGHLHRSTVFPSNRSLSVLQRSCVGVRCPSSLILALCGIQRPHIPPRLVSTSK